MVQVGTTCRKPGVQKGVGEIAGGSDVAVGGREEGGKGGCWEGNIGGDRCWLRGRT